MSEMSGWQPIETAPRGGTCFLASRQERGESVGGIVVARRKTGWSEWYTVPGDWSFKASHWMPLPAAPEASS